MLIVDYWIRFKRNQSTRAKRSLVEFDEFFRILEFVAVAADSSNPLPPR
jgi:hypothetical protein